MAERRTWLRPSCAGCQPVLWSSGSLVVYLVLIWILYLIRVHIGVALIMTLGRFSHKSIHTSIVKLVLVVVCLELNHHTWGGGVSGSETSITV